MEFAEIKYTKTVEGLFDVTLIHNNTVVATINFPTEALAAEYVDIKTKLKSHAEALIAEVTANLTKEVKNVKATIQAARIEAQTAVTPKVAEVAPVIASEVEAELGKTEDKVDTFVANIKNRVEKAAHIDTSAKVGVQPRIDTSAKVGKDTVIDTSAKIVVPE